MNGITVKTEAVDEESEAIKELLKRVPYKTNSIFFRNISPAAKIEEIETECKNFPGFLRIGLSEPLNDQNFSRRLWASYRRDVKIKEIFWNIKNAKVGFSTFTGAHSLLFSSSRETLNLLSIEISVAEFEQLLELLIIAQSFRMTSDRLHA